MTLSNFDWTDKTSVKWFIMLPTGHEGPYSLLSLIKRKTSPDMKVWAEGLPAAVLFKLAVKNSQELKEIPKQVIEEDEIPPIPFIKNETEFLPPILEFESVNGITVAANDFKLPKKIILTLGVLIIVIFGLKEWVKGRETFSIYRPAGMDSHLFQKISTDFKFDDWNKKIFFKEYVPSDMSRIWLVTSGFQNCKIEASFSSVKDKLLTMKDEKISFKSRTRLSGHIAEFSHFEFVAGTKILPGLYEMDLKAFSCSWDGIDAKLGNIFKAPDDIYVTRMKVVLYHKGNIEFISVLDQVINKKIKIEEKNQNQEELYWQDLQQKLQTLLAITLQIEQLLLEFADGKPADFKKNLKVTVDKYTRNFGHFLTEFVVANEKYFKNLEKSDISNLAEKRKHEKVIRTSSTQIGMESMKIIEQFQSWKKTNKNELSRASTRIKKQFELLKENLNQRLIQMTEDRSN